MAKLTKEEKSLLSDFEKGEFKSLPNKDVVKYQRYARATFQKDRRVNIRISSKDLQGLQKRALREGIPYQTLMASILHKFVAGLFVDRQS